MLPAEPSSILKQDQNLLTCLRVDPYFNGYDSVCSGARYGPGTMGAPIGNMKNITKSW